VTTPELRVFFQSWFCGCGAPDDAADALRRLLLWHERRDDVEELYVLLPDTGMQYLLLYTLDRYELTEHGGSVIGAWLTDKGKAILAALVREKELDNYESLFVTSCVHGIAIGERCDECQSPQTVPAPTAATDPTGGPNPLKALSSTGEFFGGGAS
jgi:hypothetical protein